MSAASFALQQGIFAALTSSLAVKSFAGDPARVFDSVPRDAAFPFIVIGEDRETDWSTATEKGSEHGLAIHIWSRGVGRKQAKLAASAVRSALDTLSPSLDGQTLVALRHEQSDFFRESDGETIHAVLRFRARIEEN